MEYNKLVRDKIPEIIKQDGGVPVTHIATDDEYRVALLAKLQEEVTEFRKDSSQGELVDVLEVAKAICELRGWDLAELEKLRKLKAEKRGGFTKRIVLERTE